MGYRLYTTLTKLSVVIYVFLRQVSNHGKQTPMRTAWCDHDNNQLSYNGPC